MRIERVMSETRIYAQHILITVKENYNPPLVWIEVYKPRKNRYEIAIQLNGNSELADAFETVARTIRQLIAK